MGSRSAELVDCWVGAASIEARKIFSAKPTRSGSRPAIVRFGRQMRLEAVQRGMGRLCGDLRLVAKGAPQRF